jgi:hypothetical protein
MESKTEMDAPGEAYPAPRKPELLASQTLAQKLASRPVTTAVVCVLAGAFVAEGIALLFGKARERRAVRENINNDPQTSRGANFPV